MLERVTFLASFPRKSPLRGSSPRWQRETSGLLEVNLLVIRPDAQRSEWTRTHTYACTHTDTHTHRHARTHRLWSPTCLQEGWRASSLPDREEKCHVSSRPLPLWLGFWLSEVHRSEFSQWVHYSRAFQSPHKWHTGWLIKTFIKSAFSFFTKLEECMQNGGVPSDFSFSHAEIASELLGSYPTNSVWHPLYFISTGKCRMPVEKLFLSCLFSPT